MNLYDISNLQLAYAFIPALLALIIFYRWTAGAGNASYAVGRMLLQLLLIGYALAYIFETEHPVVVLGVLTVMLSAAAWISLNSIGKQRKDWLVKAALAIGVVGMAVLILVTQAVVAVEPWYAPNYVIPLAGMIFANTMNAVSLAAERFMSEREDGLAYEEARRKAFKAAMIPVVNSLFAVGLVSLPGMMTGQILSGVSPLIAARYQIVVMSMLFGAAGLSTAWFLAMLRPKTAA
ncbi:ABC transporter permease [Litorivivens sp.]|uniref:ABC transporter permease n=1 Tax=Litorivivens sp. TaxID=2020868 RepID=UPI0035671542